jgi:predicted RNA-binding protein with TRAM domain
MIVKIDKLSHEMRGIAKIDNKVTFVDKVIPNEVVNIRVTKQKKKINEAKLVSIIEKSPNRIEPKCQYYNICGGCNIEHISYNKSVIYKKEIVKNIFNKYCNMNIEPSIIYDANNTYNYRNKITLSGSDNITDKKATITVSGVNGAFVTKDANATSGTNTFTFGDKIYIKVPVKNVNQSSEIKITAQGSYIRYSGKLYDCTHVGNSIENQNVVDYDITEGKKNASASLTTKITLNKVVISKTDITGSKEIAGAKLSVKQGNTEVTSWTSTTTPKKLSLAPGTYTLEETIAPKGYIKSTSKITFVVKSDGTITVDGKKVTSVVMKNEPITIYISKKSINGKTELPGAKLKVTDKDGKVVTDLDGKELEWISSTKEVSFHLPAGTYYLTETIAPEGYELSDTTIEFTVTEDGKVKMDKKDVDNNLIVFTNTPEPTPVKTGSFMIYIVVIGILSVGLVTYYVIKKQIV